MWLGIGVKIVNWWRSLAAANGPFSNHATLTNGLVSYWKLDEQSGVRYDSVVASANDLTDNNTVTYVNAGPSGVVADFVAANNESLSHSGASFAGNIPFTVAFWSNCTKSGALTGWVGRDGANRDWSIIASNTGWQFYHLNTGFPSVTVAKTTPVGTFDFVVAWLTPDGGEMGMSVNGATPVTNTSAAATNNPSILSMGATGGSGANTGNIGRVGFWNAILTSGQRTSLFNSGVGKSYSALTTAEKVGLVSYWNLDEVSGTRADSHGSNTLTDNNTVTSSLSGPSGVVAKFTQANSEYLSVADNASLDVITTASWQFWFKAPNGIDQTLASKWTYATDGGWAIQTHSAEADEFFIFIATTAGGDGSQCRIRSNDANLVTGNYYHLLVVFDGALVGEARLKVYQNGVLLSTTTDLGAIPATLLNNTTELVVGGFPGLGRYWNNAMGRLGLWNVALASSVATSLFNSGVGKSYSALTTAEKVGLVSYWNLDEASGNRADSHGSNTLTDNNTVTSVMNAGGAMRNIAASFVYANSEFLSRAAITPLTANQARTVALWWKPNTPVSFPNGLFSVSATVNSGSPFLIISNQFSLADGLYLFIDGYGANVTGVVDQTWHQVIYTFDGTTAHKLYLNNGTAGTRTAADSVNASTNMYVGSGYSGSATGSIDELGIWSRVLTAQERTDLWNSGAGLFY